MYLLPVGEEFSYSIERVLPIKELGIPPAELVKPKVNCVCAPLPLVICDVCMILCVVPKTDPVVGLLPDPDCCKY